MLEPFQRATVEAAIATLSGNGPRRFLIADEVGLGKTMIAREIARALKGKRAHFNVLYLCPSLEIVGQNRAKFIELTGIEEEQYTLGEDRLSLVSANPPQRGDGFRIYAFTPETSLPGWKPGIRTGRKAERELIRRIVDPYPPLLKQLLALDRARKSRPLLPGSSGDLSGFSRKGLDRALRDVFACEKKPFSVVVREWLERGDTGIAEFIGRARSAMALATLRSGEHRPDLIILDEFHRYADLILPQPEMSVAPIRRERARIHGLLIEALLNGPQRPGILLLSATPYRLRRLSGEDLHPVEHYRALIDLAGFLTANREKQNEVESAMRAYQGALRGNDQPGEVSEAVKCAKRRIEAVLRPVIARTERALVHEDDLFNRPKFPIRVESRDLEIFRHFARSISGADGKLRGWAPALWSSVPYPNQTLHGYALWPTIVKAGQPPIELNGRDPPAHPQLRELAKIVGDARQLSLPWQPPTLSWWRLEGPWADNSFAPGKTLLFSKWRAAPTAISAILSLHLEEDGRARRGVAKRSKPALLRPGGGDSSALVGLFMPWPTLAHAIEPLKDSDISLRHVRRRARRDLETFLTHRLVRLTGARKRPIWEVACGLERYLSQRGFQRLLGAARQAKTGKGGRMWSEMAGIAEISPAELHALADHLLSAPGSILARCARRHNVPTDSAAATRSLFQFSWGRLRGYLGHRSFARLIGRSSKLKRYPEVLCEATLKGGFEAVLDEQMSVLCDLGGIRPKQILKELEESLLDRPGRVRLRRKGKVADRISVQAVVPFNGGEQQRASKKKGGKMRNDALRKAFNSPFWPHLLATTSVGQEGLDFHLWCDRIVHWDLPSDPVDFEQREGRIARYASLTVRRSIAKDHGERALVSGDASSASPFSQLLKTAREQPSTHTGLETWWLPRHAKPVSVTFDWQFSLKTARKEMMLQDLLYYRLGLGQPDPEAFMKMLKRIDASPALARSLAINLAAIGSEHAPDH
ncbi:DEAD/DEAH box helicase family protein [Ensifer sp. ENS10]|uniref:DEAD/DEAH box helicase family protein n=1 Tax=Ensifer sp. ENS10 TaxID=2769286 RepID=UPI0017853703|nr:DEAD/DEAH box helicase family protein [Ensifer sp. ENS10]MBD9511990.1 DEAD/DEAH box helicase family protein [Ensifer sp. ENS10]